MLWVDTDFGGKTVIEKVVTVKEFKQWKQAGYFMETKKENSKSGSGKAIAPPAPQSR